MKSLVRRIVFFLLALTLLTMTGCATLHAWDRDLLAEEGMTLNANPMLRGIDDHIYFSKEGSTGGNSVGGGGCGCN